MGRTLTELATTLCIDVDEKTPPDSVTLAKAKGYVNRAYKEVAKRQGLEKTVTLASIDSKIEKPVDYYKTVRVEYQGTPIPNDEEDNYISIGIDAEVSLIYNYLPADLGDNAEPLTDKANDEAILCNAKYMYLKSDNKHEKAEIEKRDFETMYIKRQKKNLQFIVER